MSSDLSPPDSTKTALDNLTGTSGALIDAFDEIIRLPFVESIRLDAAGDRSVESVILELREKYQRLQTNTLPFARNLYGYAGLQLTAIPEIEKSIPLQTYLNLNKTIIARHRLEAAAVKRDSEAFRKEFSAAIDLFNESIEDLKKQIEDLDVSIRKTEDQYEKEKAAAIIAGILTGFLVAAAVVAILATAGAAAAGAGVAGAGAASVGAGSAGASTAAATGGTVAGTGLIATFAANLAAVGGTTGIIGATVAVNTGALGALTTTILASLEAGNLKDALDAMRSLRRSAEATRDNLTTVVGLMEKVEGSLDEIVSIWTDVENSLDVIQADVDGWTEANFSEELASVTVDEWEEVRESVQKYTAVVSGSRSLRAAPVPEEPPHSIPITGPAELITAARGIAESELKLSLSAPDVEFEGRLSDFESSSRALKNLISIRAVDSKLKSKSESASGVLAATMNGLAKSAERLNEIAAAREAWLEKFEMVDYAGRTELLKSLKPQSSELEADLLAAVETEQTAFKYQFAVGEVTNLLIGQINENVAKQEALVRQLRKVEADQRMRKWLWFIPIAGAINELVDVINNIRGKIKRIRRHINDLKRMRQVLTSASSSIKNAVADSTRVVQTFSEILNDTQVGAHEAVLFETLREDIPAELLKSSTETWVELREDIEAFQS